MTASFLGIRGCFAALAVFVLAVSPVAAQHAEGQGEPGHDIDAANLFVDLDEDVAVVKNKLMGLAEAIPEDQYDWRPGEGVRSVRETLLHVAADNYFIPIALGHQPPASTGISDYMSTQAFEKRELSKDEVRDEVEQSFTYLRRILGESDRETVGDAVSLFGMDSTVQKAWILTTTHLHEHLGQMIAYARSNDVVPPWSR